MPAAKRVSKREQELRERWQRLQIDPEVVRRAQELADLGRWEERGQLIVDHVRKHPGIVAAEKHNAEHPEEAIPWRELKRKQRRGRKRI